MTELHGRVVAIVQARMGSTRLPGKVLADLAGAPMLARVVDRARRARTLHALVVATTTDPSDDAVAELCKGRGYPCVRGHPTDVLDRYYQAARQLHAGVVVRLTGDCPLIDPDVIDETVRAFLDADPPYDLVANRLAEGRTFPIGLDTEVCSLEALAAAWREASDPYEREHVFPFIYEQRERFRVLLHRGAHDHGALRWTVDTAEDLEVIRRVYQHFGGRDDFTWLEVLDLFQQEPSLAELNAHVEHRGFREAGRPGGTGHGNG
jgi:spore coat polysaccharide biosynthesis protein SpsF